MSRRAILPQSPHPVESYEGRLNSQLNKEIGDLKDRAELTRMNRLSAYNAATAAPTGNSWAIGDIVRNSNPVEVDETVLRKYFILGWMCTANGTPGTWKEIRMLSETAATGGGTCTPAPPDKSVQWNDGLTAFGGSAQFLFEDATGVASLGNNAALENGIALNVNETWTDAANTYGNTATGVGGIANLDLATGTNYAGAGVAGTAKTPVSSDTDVSRLIGGDFVADMSGDGNALGLTPNGSSGVGVVGVRAQAWKSGAGTATSLIGVYSEPQNDGAGSISYAYSMYAGEIGDTQSVIDTAVGLFVADVLVGTNQWSVVSGLGSNEFAGTVAFDRYADILCDANSISATTAPTNTFWQTGAAFVRLYGDTDGATGKNRLWALFPTGAAQLLATEP